MEAKQKVISSFTSSDDLEFEECPLPSRFPQTEYAYFDIRDKWWRLLVYL